MFKLTIHNFETLFLCPMNSVLLFFMNDTFFASYSTVYPAPINELMDSSEPLISLNMYAGIFVPSGSDS